MLDVKVWTPACKRVKLHFDCSTEYYSHSNLLRFRNKHSIGTYLSKFQIIYYAVAQTGKQHVQNFIVSALLQVIASSSVQQTDQVNFAPQSTNNNSEQLLAKKG